MWTLTSECLLPARDRHPLIEELDADLNESFEGTQAARDYLDQLQHIEETLATIHYPAAHAELKQQLAAHRDPLDFSYEPPSPAENRALQDVDAYQDLAPQLLPVTATLVALSLLRRDCDLAGARELLNAEPWCVQHEALTRLAWMRNHRELLQLGHKSEDAYRCHVAPRSESRFRQTDREFHSLLLLGHAAKLEEGREFLIGEKREGPDFLVIDTSSGEDLGVEVTEAPQNEIWSHEEAAREAVRGIIKSSLTERGLSADLTKTPKSWNELRQQSAEFEQALDAGLDQLGSVGQPTALELGHFGLELSVRPAANRPGIGLEGLGWTTSSDIENANDELRSSLLRSVNKKVNGAPPEVTPCILVCYLAHDYPADVETAISALTKEDLPDLGSNFEELWVVCGHGSARLI